MSLEYLLRQYILQLGYSAYYYNKIEKEKKQKKLNTDIKIIKNLQNNNEESAT